MRKGYVIVLYIRISVEDDDNGKNGKDESNSVTNQRNLLRNFIQNHAEFQSGTVIELCDDGYSGTNFERPAIKKLLEKAKAQEIDCVIVKDFSRFGREYLTVSDYVDQIFPFLGIRFISVNDNYDSANCNGSTSGVDIAFKNVINGYYSKDISQKVKSGKRTKALKGDFLSPFAPIGYRKDKKNKNQLLIEEETAAVVKRIFQMAGMGMTVIKITRLLNAEKIPTPSKFKNKQGFYHLWWNGIGGNKLWDSNVVLAILRDERYLGSVVYGKRFRPEVGNYRTVKNGKSDWIVVPDRHEPVVTVEEFKAAQANLREYVEQDSFGKTIHLFTGKIRCGVCGYALARNHSADPRFDCTTKYRVDDCDCMKGSIKESEIAEVVLTAIHAYIKVLLDEQTLIKRAKKDNRISTLRKQIAVYQSTCGKFAEQKAELYDFKADGKISETQYKEKYKALVAQQDDIERQLKKLIDELADLEHKISRDKVKEQELNQYLMFDTLTREMVVAFVDCIHVYNDKSIHVKWLFDEPS